MKRKNFYNVVSKTKELEISLEVKPICKKYSAENKECEEKAQEETRKLMDDIWRRYPTAEVSRVNFESNSIVFEL